MTVDDLGEFPGIDGFPAYRGEPGTEDAPPIWLPIHQGDVFRGLAVPGIDPPDSEPPMAMVFMHPCVMRNGAVLTERVTVFRVRRETKKTRPSERFADNFSVMPLPDLLDTGAGVHFAEFHMVGTVPGSALDRAERVVALTKEGRLLLQQRAVHHFTRHAPPLGDFRTRTRGVEREMELLADWCEAACDSAGETSAVVAEAEKEFDEYLSADERRARLIDDDSTNTVVMEVQGELQRRYP
ncbi:MAG: hypothetical protein WBG14_00515 [Rhodococcus sp. (in: high G+C Gram-positive bacteria)]